MAVGQLLDGCEGAAADGLAGDDRRRSSRLTGSRGRNQVLCPVSAVRVSRCRWAWMLAMTRECRATSVCQPRSAASSRSAVMSASWAWSCGDELGGGDVVVALLADVGVGAGLGGELAGAVAVGDPGLEHLGAQPFDPAGDDGLAGWGDGQGQPGAGLVHCFFVGDADGGGGQRGVAQGHLGGHVAEQGHQRLQRHARVDQACRICVAELVRGGVQGLPVMAAQAGRRGGVIQPAAQPVGGQAAAAFGEQEVGWPARAGDGAGPAVGRAE